MSLKKISPQYLRYYMGGKLIAALYLHLIVQEFPFRPKSSVTAEYARGFLHLRPRTAAHQSLLRVRNTAAMAVHKYFQVKGLLKILRIWENSDSM